MVDGKTVHKLMKETISLAIKFNIDPATFFLNALAVMAQENGFCKDCFTDLFEEAMKVAPESEFSQSCESCDSNKAVMTMSNRKLH